jgi:hypothetical protein
MLMHVARAVKGSVSGRNGYRLYIEDVEVSNPVICKLLWQNLSYRRGKTTKGTLRLRVSSQRQENISFGIQRLNVTILSAYFDTS